MSMTEPFIGGYNQLSLVAKLSAFGASTTKTLTLQSGANGLPKPYTMTAGGTLKPFSGFNLGSGKAEHKWDGKSTSASAAGQLKLGKVVDVAMSTLISTSGAVNWSGTGIIRMAYLLKAKLTLSGTSSASSANVSLRAKFKGCAAGKCTSVKVGCSVGSKPECCVKLPLGVGKKCLKLY